MEPHHAPRHARKRGGRWLLPALVGSACAVFLLCLLPHLMPTASGQPAASPAPVESAPDSGTPGISVNWEPSPSPAPEEQEEAPWYLRLVNLENRLPQDFTVELAQVDGGQFDARAAEALSQMLADMEAQGLSPMVCSSFRTWEDQETLHQNKIGRLLEEGYSQEAAEAEASRWVVPAGASEHQLGLAADIVASQYQILEEEQENTPEQQWLMAHCQEYGFILRYPKDKTEVTGVGYEPWHYRYVGVEAAREIMAQGICLEEYLGR